MEELKTLKDIGFCNNYDCCFNYHADELKAEAIKWVKDVEKTTMYQCCHEKLISFIKHFFDIK